MQGFSVLYLDIRQLCFVALCGAELRCAELLYNIIHFSFSLSACAVHIVSTVLKLDIVCMIVKLCRYVGQTAGWLAGWLSFLGCHVGSACLSGFLVILFLSAPLPAGGLSHEPIASWLRCRVPVEPRIVDIYEYGCKR